MSKLLKEYNRKRDFKKTKEPSGLGKVKKADKPIFVVQEHHASRLHYDFRLEMEGVLKSWAVPKGPSQDPKDKRLAVQTEDHPISYAHFHGVIPEGEYGGGDVFIWDEGTWECDEADPVAALKKGRIEFSLKGKRLEGKWLLIRTHYKETKSKKNWLLIKRSDGEQKVSKTSSIDPFPDFIEPQLPKLVTEPPTDEEDWIHELKFDGYRIQSHLKEGISRLFTRNGLDWTRSFPHVNIGIEKLKVTDAIFDGEIVALDSEGRSNFQRLQNSLTEKKDSGLMYYVFDLLYLNGKDIRKLPLVNRKELLKKVLSKTDKHIIFSESFETDPKEFLKVSCEHQLEGIISKKAAAPYYSGRSEIWVKTKCTSRQEFVIGGWTNPKGDRLGIGALLVGYYKDKKFVYAGKVGTGFDHKMLKTMEKDLKKISTKVSPFEVRSPKSKEINWVKPVRVCEVSFSNWTDEEVLRTPVFMGMRLDKAPEAITKEVPKERKMTKKVAKKVAKKVSKKSSKKEEEHGITSPEKVIFKKEKKTKQDISNFYKKIAPVMIPYLANRPLSLVRCPQGSAGKCFFQKHVHGDVPASFRTFPLKEEKGEGDYFSIDSSKGLQELVQINAYEIHTWNCHAEKDFLPDQFVMDFDPGPKVKWSTVIEAAFEVKALLDDLNLKSFLKLSGGKGVHIHVPIAPLYSWDQIKSFTQTLANEMVARRPELYVSNMSKKLRVNKIFLDYLRNGYGATAVAPYSLRNKETSSVALPIEWSELKKIKDPMEMTMDKALKKIKSRKKDPWAGYLKLKQKIKILKPV
jgi:bifunctional non-homologous end joining protein LigD